MMFLSMISWGQPQVHKLPEPQMSVESDSSPPPPPGLPIDFIVPGLIAGGLAIGIYYIRVKKLV